MPMAVGAEGLRVPQLNRTLLQAVPQSGEVLPDNMSPFTARPTQINEIVNFRDTSYHAWKAAKTEREAQGEIKEREYGAFIQILVKDGDNISYRSLGLPRGTTPEMVQKMMKRTLDPEAAPKTFDDGKLVVLAQTDTNREINVADRMVEAAFAVVREDHPDQKDASVQKFYEKYPLIKEELRKNGSRFGEYLDGPAQARVADGVHIHHGSFMMKDKTVIGPDINGELWDLSTIAQDQGHKDQMGEVVSLFVNNKKVTAMVGDTSATVGKCFEACADYYEWKESVHHGEVLQEVYSQKKLNNVKDFVKESIVYTPEVKMEHGCDVGHRKGQCNCRQAEQAEAAISGE